MKIFDRDSLPAALKPLTNRQLAVGLAICLPLLALAGCGGGDSCDPEQHKNEPSPNCAMHPESCK